MKKLLLSISVLLLAVLVFALYLGSAAAGDEAKTATSKKGSADTTVYGYTMARIDGTPQSLGDYKGKVLVLVNTASKCGLTPQYEGLQALYETYGKEGLVVLGFPANNFLNQEPGSNEDIAAFCDSRYHVTFPMFSKISVKGSDQHPLYRFLTVDSQVAGPVKWNFQKYIIDRSGHVVAKIHPKVKPRDPRVIEIIEGELARDAKTHTAAHSEPKAIGF